MFLTIIENYIVTRFFFYFFIYTFNYFFIREVAKFLNCIQEHCADSLSPCEMDAARQVMLAKFDDTGIRCG